MLARGARAEVGNAAPNFVLVESHGWQVDLAALRGNPVIVAFSAPSWDPSRADQLAHYNTLVESVPGANAKLLGISSDGIWCKLAFEGDEVRVPLLADLDPCGAVAKLYGVSGENALFVIDSGGIIRWAYSDTGDQQMQTGALITALTALAPDPQAPRGLFEPSARTKEIRRADESIGIRKPLYHPERREGANLSCSTESPAPSLHSAQQHPNGQFPDSDALCVWRPLTANRREFVATALAAACVLAATPLLARAQPLADKVAEPEAGLTTSSITLNVNGRNLALDIEPRVTLLDALREYANLNGTKKGCDHGQCGACTVHIDGRRQLSCMTFAMMHQGAKITTVEGLASGDTLHPMQAAFIKHDGFQCGYCTPGQLMSATALLREPCGPADNDVKECMSGNICRCGAYPGIVAAIQEVRAGARA